VLRTALTLSLVTGRAFRIENVRAKRARPGLLRQHLTAVRAAAEVSGAEVEGASLGSREISFRPGPVRPGAHHFQVGTAGSACLVLQTVLLPLALADGPSTVVVEGGTHGAMAPPFEHLDEVWLPHLRAIGVRATAARESYGFYPAGGGRVRVEVGPAAGFHALVLETRGEVVERRAVALVSQIPASVGEREIAVVAKTTSFRPEDCAVRTVRSHGPGNALVLTVRCERATEVFTGFGEPGRRAEAVAARVVDEMREWHAADVPVARHTADQLLLPLALAAGGSFRTLPPTLHTTTNAEVLRAFLGDVVDLAEEPAPPGAAARVRTWRVTVRPRTGR
jgi:RNA 3'-terminal phosphate cyclase (ATP)